MSQNVVVLSSLAFDPSNSSVAYAAGDDYYGDGNGVFKTVDGGAHWTDLGVETAGVVSVVVDPRARSTVYLATEKVSGRAWTAECPGRP